MWLTFQQPKQVARLWRLSIGFITETSATSNGIVRGSGIVRRGAARLLKSLPYFRPKYPGGFSRPDPAQELLWFPPDNRSQQARVSVYTF